MVVKSRGGRLKALAFGSVLAGTSLVGVVPGASPVEAQAVAEYPSHDAIVTDEPAPWTPQILDGRTKALAHVGDMMVLGGRFNQVAPPTGSPVRTQPNVFAFDATDGTISSTFTPSVGGEVRAVEAGPTPGTVYVAGGFGGVNGQNGKIFLLNVSDGSIVPSFDDPPLNGAVNDLALVDGTLYVGGTFSTAAGVTHEGLVALDPTTGAVDPSLSIDLTENHNWDEGENGARGAVGAKSIDVDAAGTTLVAIGNFRKADGLERDQMVLIDLTGAEAVVRPDWRTQRYQAGCATGAFDSYVRDVTFAPDGSYINVATTGGPFPGSLCDTGTRWETSGTGDDVQPSWTDDTGGDTLLSIASSGEVVYTGGHQRWLNNAGGRDSPAPGAVPRPGLGGMDPDNGLPMSWNPGRNPRGVGAEVVLVTEAGLWVGSDTDWIGNFQKFRPRISYFPLAGGTTRGDEITPDLPANIYQAGASGLPGGENALHRVNSGGTALTSLDEGISWLDDSQVDNPTIRNSGSRNASWSPVGSVTSNVPDSTPSAIFTTERWDPGAAADGNELEWDFAVDSGTEVAVRLYLANRCGCTNDPGERIFDVSIDGNIVLDDYDIVADVGDNVGTMKEFFITSDGTVDIDFGHVFENTLVNGIEILEVIPGPAPEPEPATLSRLWFDGGTVDQPQVDAPDGDIDWDAVVSAVQIDGDLFYVTVDGEFFQRSFDGQTYGAIDVVDPYNDPFWSDKPTGSGDRDYRGVQPSFYTQTPALAGMVFDDGNLYYTRLDSGRIFSRAFVPESGLMSEETETVSGFDTTGVGGIFIDPAADLLYFVDRSVGSLSSVSFVDGEVTGPATLVSGPGVDSYDWNAGVMFVGPGEAPVVNAAPMAVGSITCDGFDCTFVGSGSTDTDGTIDTYAWDFDDGTTSSDADTTHSYTSEDTYDVTLTVTDDMGDTDVFTQSVVVVENNDSPVADAVLVCDRLECMYTGSGSTDPDGTVEAHAWDFGDGSTSTDADGVHTYAEAGQYSVTLMVTDDREATDTFVQTVTVAANQGPVAAIAQPSCTLLACDFSAAGSTDADDSIVTYDWAFGDGDDATGVDVQHTFADDGIYTVSLTVTDELGAEDTTTSDVSVSSDAAPDVTRPELVGTSAVTVRSTDPSVAVPDDVVAGDLLVLFVTSNQSSEGVGPLGVGSWDQQDRVVNGPLAVTVFTRVADGSEAAQSVSMSLPSRYRTDLTMVAYRDVDSIEAFASTSDADVSSHESPVVTSNGANRTELSFWSDRSSSTTVWTAPQEVSVVSTQIGEGGGRVTTLIGEREVGAGSAGGLTASTDAPSTRAVSVSILLAPSNDGPQPNQEPDAEISSSCNLLACDFSGSGSSDPDDSIVSHEWDFGDGATAVGEDVEHTFPETGTYTVTLTVTDSFGLTASDTLIISVSSDVDPVSGAPERVGASAVNVRSTDPSVAVPDDVVAGDLLVLFVTSNQSGEGVGPLGVGPWVQEERVVNGPLVVTVFTRVADGSEASQQVSMSLPSRYKTDLTMVAYRGVESIENFASSSDQDQASHVAPVGTSTGANRTELSFWADRSSTTNEWTAPSEVSIVSTQIGIGGGRVTTLFGERGVGAGPAGGLTASTNAPSARAVSVSILLAPSPA